MKKIYMLITAGALLCVLMKDAPAQVPPVPAGQSIDAQAERFRQEYSMEKRARAQRITKAIIDEEEEQEEEGVPGATFVLKEVHVSGMTIFDPKRLFFVWKPYLNQKINFKDLKMIVRLIKRVYKDLGYLTTTAYLPPQDIKDGVIEIKVVEGKRGNLNLEGNRWFSSPSIEKYFHTYRGEVLDMGSMQRDVMRLNSVKDFNVSSVLSPGADPETVDVTLKAKETVPYHVSVGTDNEGSRLTGRFRELVDISTSNLTGHEDSLTMNGAFSDFSAGYFASYQTPVGTNGTKVGLDGGYFYGKLGHEFKPYDVANFTVFLNPNVSYELYLSEDAQVNLRLGMQIKHVNKKQGISTVTDEDLRLPYVALDVTKMDFMGQTSFSPELSFGTSGFLQGSRTDNLKSSRPGVDRPYVKYNQYLSRNQNMPWGSYIQFNSQFQTASRTLPTSEQIQLGGAGSIRGYPQGDFLADIGGYLDTDWYFPMYLIPDNWLLFSSKLRTDIEPFVFYDMGGGKSIHAYGTEIKDKYLSSVGTGFRIRLRSNMYVRMEWALPTGNNPIHGTGPSSFDISFQAGI